MLPKVLYRSLPVILTGRNRDLRLEKIIADFLIATLGWKKFFAE